MAYVDVFVVPVPKARLDDYKQMAREAAEVWKSLGAREYVECLPDDVPYGELTSFPRAVQLGDDEVAVVAWIVYDSREQRDAANNGAMNDPRMQAWEGRIPFDGKRMVWGGFIPFQGR